MSLNFLTQCWAFNLSLSECHLTVETFYPTSLEIIMKINLLIIATSYCLLKTFYVRKLNFL